jgi:hypothetical protein
MNLVLIPEMPLFPHLSVLAEETLRRVHLFPSFQFRRESDFFRIWKLLCFWHNRASFRSDICFLLRVSDSFLQAGGAKGGFDKCPMKNEIPPFLRVLKV